jgi:hypothetical protein
VLYCGRCRGDRELTVVDSNVLDAEQPYAPDAVRLFITSSP